MDAHQLEHSFWKVHLEKIERNLGPFSWSPNSSKPKKKTEKATKIKTGKTRSTHYGIKKTYSGKFWRFEKKYDFHDNGKQDVTLNRENHVMKTSESKFWASDQALNKNFTSFAWNEMQKDFKIRLLRLNLNSRFRIPTTEKQQYWGCRNIPSHLTQRYHRKSLNLLSERKHFHLDHRLRSKYPIILNDKKKKSEKKQDSKWVKDNGELSLINSRSLLETWLTFLETWTYREFPLTDIFITTKLLHKFNFCSFQWIQGINSTQELTLSPPRAQSKYQRRSETLEHGKRAEFRGKEVTRKKAKPMTNVRQDSLDPRVSFLNEELNKTIIGMQNRQRTAPIATFNPV